MGIDDKVYVNDCGLFLEIYTIGIMKYKSSVEELDSYFIEK